MHKGFVEEFLEEARSIGVSGRSIKIELTENIVVHSLEDVRRKLNILAENGIYASLDDYGSGYSSLAYISSLPFSTVKIDKTLVENIVHDQRAYTIFENAVHMIKSLDKKVVVEGVETKEQFKIASKIGCDMVQGYLLEHALPPEEALALLETKRDIL
jgi:EAL domain-containing protein (putative c-di-GMP-specific phosphodiesterase class I)